MISATDWSPENARCRQTHLGGFARHRRPLGFVVDANPEPFRAGWAPVHVATLLGRAEEASTGRRLMGVSGNTENWDLNDAPRPWR